MRLLDVINAPWAIQPDKLLEIDAIYSAHLRGPKIDIGALEAKLGRPLANEPKAYEVIDGVAVLAIDGVLAKRANMFMQISGGTSMELAARDLQAAVNDNAVHSIILAIDSPGGTVDGTQTLANAVTNARASKPVVALASGTMASAAYWVGSAAQAIYVTDGTTLVGSIGVVATHRDMSGAEAQQGVKTTEVYAGQYKRIASAYEPLTKAGRQSIQDQVDYTYSLFVSAVATHRGVSEETVLKDMADGRVFMGQQAIDAGLVDGVSTLGDLVAQLNSSRISGPSNRAGVAHSQKEVTMNREQFAAQHPELLQAVLAEGATAERSRIQAVEGQAIAGHDALISTLKFDGKSTAGDAAMAVLAAEKQSRNAAASALANDAPKPLPTVTPPAVTAPAADYGSNGQITANTDTSALNAAARTYMAGHPGVDYIAAVKAVQTLQKGA